MKRQWLIGIGCLVIAVCGAACQQPGDVSATPSPSSDSQAASVTTTTTTTTATAATTTTAPVPNDVYTFTTETITKGDGVHIDYPQLTGGENVALQSVVNDRIYQHLWDSLFHDFIRDVVGLSADDDEETVLSRYAQINTEDISYTITLNSRDTISIVYQGKGMRIDSGRSGYVICATTIDMRTGALLELSDFTAVDEALVDRLREADTVLYPFEEAVDQKEWQVYVQSTDSVIEGLRHLRSNYSFHVTPDALWISIPCPANGPYALARLDR